MKDCPLVMIEWEDSAQPLPNWRYLADFEADGAVLCTSVGWLIHDGEDVKALAPNMGGSGQKAACKSPALSEFLHAA